MTEIPTFAELLPEVDFAGRQIIGNRECQEDFYGVVPPGEADLAHRDLLVVLADGMGGHAAGEVASLLVVEEFAGAFMDSPHDTDTLRLENALLAANRSIAEKVKEAPSTFHGMGTTLLALLVRDHSLRWISVGDSPLILWRAGELRLLNKLHSFEAGVVSARLEEGAAPGRGVLASALIGSTLYEVDFPDSITLEARDILLASSDGMNTLTLPEVAELLKHSMLLTAAEIAERLLDEVFHKGLAHQDNATLVVVKITNPT